jgi:hypothetical protein
MNLKQIADVLLTLQRLLDVELPDALRHLPTTADLEARFAPIQRALDNVREIEARLDRLGERAYQ